VVEGRQRDAFVHRLRHTDLRDLDGPDLDERLGGSWVGGGLSGLGSVAGTVVVSSDRRGRGLLVVLVVVEVDVGGGVVVVSAVVGAAAVIAAAWVVSAARSEPPSPQAANVRINTQLADVQARRMAHSASESALQQCTHGQAAGLHARRNADAVIAGAGQGDAGGQPPFGRGDGGTVMRPVLRERHFATG
jgi:hypothetical protein